MTGVIPRGARRPSANGGCSEFPSFAPANDARRFTTNGEPTFRFGPYLTIGGIPGQGGIEKNEEGSWYVMDYSFNTRRSLAVGIGDVLHHGWFDTYPFGDSDRCHSSAADFGTKGSVTD